MLMPFADDQQKSFMIQVAKLFIATHEITHYVFVSESWFVTSTDGVRPDLPPAEHPGRKEGLIVMSINHDRHRSKAFEIIRDSERPILAEVAHSMEGCSGIFTELLPPRGVKLTPEQKALGLLALKKAGFYVTPMRGS